MSTGTYTAFIILVSKFCKVGMYYFFPFYEERLWSCLFYGVVFVKLL